MKSLKYFMKAAKGVNLMEVLKLAGTGSVFATKLMTSLMTGSAERNYEVVVRNESAWEEEKDDILERANWLCSKILRPVDELVKDMPAFIGEEFMGQYAIYCSSMLAHALANIAHIYPDKRAKVPAMIAQLVDMVNTPEIRNYDTIMWHQDAIKTLNDKSERQDKKGAHMTYLSILAWIISNYKLAGGDNRYDGLYCDLCDALHRRMLASTYDLNLLSFPHMQIFMADMCVPIIALYNYGRLFDNRYEATVKQWILNARTKWCDKRTGLLAGMLPGASRRQKGKRVLGSYTALMCSYLSLVDEDFAREQYNLMVKHMRIEIKIGRCKGQGVREYLNRTPQFAFKRGDAALIIKGLSSGGTAFALGGATRLGDWEFRSQMLRTAEIAGGTVKEHRKRHYKLGEFFMVGEATALAMRTNIKR